MVSTAWLGVWSRQCLGFVWRDAWDEVREPGWGMKVAPFMLVLGVVGTLTGLVFLGVL